MKKTKVQPNRRCTCSTGPSGKAMLGLGAALVVDGDDWRLTNQERYLQGAALQWSRWIRPRADSDHDHCSFCWAKFMEEPNTDVLHFGYTTTDRYHWICEQCFEDFKNKFHWRIESRA